MKTWELKANFDHSTADLVDALFVQREFQYQYQTERKTTDSVCAPWAAADHATVHKETDMSVPGASTWMHSRVTFRTPLEVPSIVKKFLGADSTAGSCDQYILRDRVPGEVIVMQRIYTIGVPMSERYYMLMKTTMTPLSATQTELVIQGRNECMGSLPLPGLKATITNILHTESRAAAQYWIQSAQQYMSMRPVPRPALEVYGDADVVSSTTNVTMNDVVVLASSPSGLISRRKGAAAALSVNVTDATVDVKTGLLSANSVHSAGHALGSAGSVYSHFSSPGSDYSDNTLASSEFRGRAASLSLSASSTYSASQQAPWSARSSNYGATPRRHSSVNRLSGSRRRPSSIDTRDSGNGSGSGRTNPPVSGRRSRTNRRLPSWVPFASRGRKYNRRDTAGATVPAWLKSLKTLPGRRGRSNKKREMRAVPLNESDVPDESLNMDAGARKKQRGFHGLMRQAAKARRALACTRASATVE
eukprot:GFYU01000739.1.p1 GENE.GFYU01000739.1~~GFYU01000739.1.p1  ORF type:complete len:476 (+),score=110.53 GFYU01000739.1:271-1698(+)